MEGLRRRRAPLWSLFPSVLLRSWNRRPGLLLVSLLGFFSSFASFLASRACSAFFFCASLSAIFFNRACPGSHCNCVADSMTMTAAEGSKLVFAASLSNQNGTRAHISEKEARNGGQEHAVVVPYNLLCMSWHCPAARLLLHFRFAFQELGFPNSTKVGLPLV